MPSKDEMSTLPASDPNRKAQLKGRNQTSWHLRKPDQGPATLAVKNREPSYRSLSSPCKPGHV
jgi:hypothetical protein